MKLRDYLTEKMGWIFCIIAELSLIILMGTALRINVSYMVSVVFLEILVITLIWGCEYRKKHNFYQDMLEKLDGLDKKYLITEMIEKPGFLEGDIFCEVLYETNKSMNDRIGECERSERDFKEYIEMWIHEIKLPISALLLMNHNGKTDFRSYRKQMDKISNYVEQILYFVRADTPQEDFLMKVCNMEEMINEVLLEHKEVLIDGKFTISKKDTEAVVVTDAKWLKFMLGQIINNSIKYKKGESGYLGFEIQEETTSVTLVVEDHGIGVPSADVKRVFDKSFTGANGRIVVASTGMGLYICRKMCEKLGHQIWMESEEDRFTKVMIRFGKDRYYVNRP